MTKPALGTSARRSVVFIAILGLTCQGHEGLQDSSGLETLSFQVSEGTRLSLDLSPDGRTIVTDLLGQLWTVPADGGPARPLTDAVRDTAEDLDPSFSPDARHIVFHGERAGRTGLWLLDVQGGGPRQLTQYPDPEDVQGNPAWSPDGKTIGFTHLLSRDSLRRRRTGIALYDVATGSSRELAVQGLPSPNFADPSWDPTGERIVIVSRRASDDAGGRVWIVAAAGGQATPLTREGIRAIAPAVSPDGDRLAFFAVDSLGRAQIWVQAIKPTPGIPTQITHHADVSPTRVRWTPRGDSLLYSADGRLWKASAAGGSPAEIRFTAQISIVRPRRELPPAHFPDPGKPEPVRAFMGMALSPDGQRIALLALHQLWVMDLEGQPRAVATVPPSARHLSWSPSGDRVAWSAGAWDHEDLYATALSTGKTERITTLPGREVLPAYSPDGRYLGFVYVPPGGDGGIRVVESNALEVSDTGNTRNLGDVQAEWTGTNAFAPVWSPRSDGILKINEGFSAYPPPQGTVARLDGRRLSIDRFPDSPLFMQWTGGSLTYIRHARLWQVPFDTGGMTGAAEPLGADPAMFLAAALNGTLLYISDGGLRLRSPDGTERRLGWPLRYTPPIPAPLLIRNVRIITGGGQPATMPRDILIERGRLARIASPGSIASQGRTVLDAGGRFVIPGLIDLHAHEYRPDLLSGFLYFGVTTIRDQGAPLAPLVAYADAIADGIFPGPRVSYGGLQYYSDWAYDAEDWEGVEPEADPDHLKRAIALAGIFGAQHVKTRTFRRWDINARFITEAHRLGLRATGHCAHQLPLVAAGMDSKEHAGFCSPRSDGKIYDDMVQLYHAAGISVVPTIWYSALAAGMDRPDRLDGDTALLPFLTPREDFDWMIRLTPAQRREFNGYAEDARRAALQLSRAGVIVATGTDVWQVPTGVHEEMAELVASGFSPLEAIRAATANAAHVLGAEGDLGTIEVGKWADLVILDGDPTSDIRNTRQIWNVIRTGQVVDRAAIRSSR